jgi:hypothetical protein
MLLGELAFMNNATLKSLVGLLSSPSLTPAQHEMYAKIVLTLSTNGVFVSLQCPFLLTS